MGFEMSVIRLCLQSDWNYQRNVDEKTHTLFQTVFKDVRAYEECKYEVESEVIILLDELDNIPDEIIHHKYVCLKPLKKLRFSEFENKIPDLNKAPSLESVKEVIKQTFQIHLPNNDLLNFRSVDYLENECTDMLGDYLDKGWRIIAVCPQVGKRRPDYILGHQDIGIKTS